MISVFKIIFLFILLKILYNIIKKLALTRTQNIFETLYKKSVCFKRNFMKVGPVYAKELNYLRFLNKSKIAKRFPSNSNRSMMKKYNK